MVLQHTRDGSTQREGDVNRLGSSFRELNAFKGLHKLKKVAEGAGSVTCT